MKILLKLNLFMLFFIQAHLLFAQFEEFENEDKQKEEKSFSLSDRIFFGGDFGLQFGTITSINVSPQVGYRFTNWLNAGITGTYIYYSDKRYNYQTSIYGGGIFTQIIPVKFLLLHAEVSYLNLDSYTNYPNIKRVWDMPVLVGGGYRMPVGEKGSINYMILWNINETENSPYSNPIIRLNFNF